MMIALLAVAVANRPAFQDAQTPYSDTQLGLSFTHPSTWINETELTDKNAKKGKKKKKTDGDTVHFKIPITGANEDADLVIMRANFSGSADTWQQVQVDANKNLNRTIQRQWQQEILGVPLLLTQINYTDNGTAETTLTGLLYNDSANKLLFRLTGPASDFDKAQYEFNQTMLTLHTTDNTLPKAEDPQAKKEPKVDPKELKHPIYLPPPPPKPVIAPVAIPLVVSTKKVELHVPTGWTAVKTNGADLDLHNAALPYDLHIHLATPLDSDQPQIALNKASAVSLADFDVVERREDDPVKVNTGGCQVTSTWRTGSNAKGRVASMEAAGVSGQFYFIASCRPSTDAVTLLAQRKMIEELLGHISIETVQ